MVPEAAVKGYNVMSTASPSLSLSLSLTHTHMLNLCSGNHDRFIIAYSPSMTSYGKILSFTSSQP